jgi:hypothetical protein
MNNNSSGMKIDNLQVLFVGSDSENATITISQGIAGNIANELEEIFSLQNIYSKSSTSAILELQKKLDREKEEIKNTIDAKQKALNSREKILIQKFSSTISKFDEQQAYNELAKILAKSNSDD